MTRTDFTGWEYAAFPLPLFDHAVYWRLLARFFRLDPPPLDACRPERLDWRVHPETEC